MSERYDISVIISTYNRSAMLTAALGSVLRQECCDVCYEVIVVDNNSSDNTREVVGAFIAEGNQDVRYIFERRQGSSYARNAGVAVARSEIIAFADDDVVVANDWISIIKHSFADHPEVDCIGGRVLPRWSTPPPKWLTRDHWMPLGLQDYGGRPLSIKLNNPLCLVSANLAFRREAFTDTGWFAPELQRIKNSIGSMEDAELLERYWRNGGECLYVPELIVETHVTAERLSRAYHRRWHTGHGYFYAIKRAAEMESASSRLFDVPAHLYRRAVVDAAAWLYFLIRHRNRAFLYETRLRFFVGFFRTRKRDYLAAGRRSFAREIISFVRSLALSKSRGGAPGHCRSESSSSD